MRLLLADPLGPAAEDSLRAAGIDPSGFDKTTESLAEAVAGQHVLVVRSTVVDNEIIEAGTRLGLIVRAGAGTDTIDTAAAARRGIFVCNVPGRNAVAVAELTMGLILAIDRSIVDAAVDLRNGQWEKSLYSKAEGLAGKTLAIVGLGSIGTEVAKRARAFDINVIGRRKASRGDEAEKAIRANGIRLVDSDDELLSSADIVSLHVPGGDQTNGMVDAEFLDRMKDGATLINTSRGSTIDEVALLEAIDLKGLRVGLDVFQNEPAAGSGLFDSPLAKHPNVVGSHHIGASTQQAQQSIVEGTVEVIEAYASGELLNCVNLQGASQRAANLIVRHVDRVGVLAEVLAVLRTHDVNIQGMNNRVFAGASAAVATIELARVPPAEAIAAIGGLDAVLGVHVQEAE